MSHLLLEALVLGLYVPIVLFSATACWLVVTRLILPAYRKGKLDVEHYAVGGSLVFALAAHLSENLYYGAARWFGKFEMLNDQLLFIGAWKLLILISLVLALTWVRAAEHPPRVEPWMAPEDVKVLYLRHGLWLLARTSCWSLIVWGFGIVAAWSVVKL